MKTFALLFAFVLALTPAFAQVPPPQPVTPPSDVVGTPATMIRSAIGIPVPSDLPKAYVAVGAGICAGIPCGFVNTGKSVATGLFLAAAVDMSQGVQSARAGLEECVYCDTTHGIYFTLKEDGGGSFGNGVAGGSYGLGGSLAIRLGKGSTRHLVVSASVVGTEAQRFVSTPVTRGTVTQLVSGGSFRIGFLNSIR